jgi:hypothetical protein
MTWRRATEAGVLDNALQFSLGVLDRGNYVSLRANATDAIGNSISQTVIRGFYVSPYGDIAVTDVTLSRTVITQGYSMSMNITVENQWIFDESFNLTVYCNETSITFPNGQNYTTIMLESGKRMTLTFPWNTAGFSKGRCSITVSAGPVPGETDTQDNLYVAGTVYVVAILGDISGPLGVPDGKVDIQDLARVSNAFGTFRGSARWNPNTDVDNDGKVDIRDVAMVARNFGKADT